MKLSVAALACLALASGCTGDVILDGPGDASLRRDAGPFIDPHADTIGSLDLIDVGGTALGWALTRSLGSQPIGVQLSVDGTVLSTVTADQPRADVNRAVGVDGDHGFKFPLPDNVRDGKEHRLYARTVGAQGQVDLSQSPMIFRLHSKLTTGILDVIEQNGMAAGWALEPYFAPASVNVRFYVDGPEGAGQLIGAVVANLPRADVTLATGYAGDHGFRLAIPGDLKDGMTHHLYAYGAGPDSSALLGGSPKDFQFTPTATHVDPLSVTEAQLRNFRADFGGIVIPEIAPQCPTDPVTGIGCTGDNGGIPHGLINGELFTASYANYTKAQRARIRQAYTTDLGVDGKPRGYTHFPLNVNCVPNVAGYHGLYPATDCSAVNDLLQELWDSHIYPVCFLSGGEWPVDLSRLDKSLCRIVVPMWEEDGPMPDTAQLNDTIGFARAQFPGALIYVHFTSDHHAGGSPEADWWRWAVEFGPDTWHSPPIANPHLAGILYQTGSPNDAAASVTSVAYMTARLGGGLDGWPGGTDVVIFETDIYQKFWDARTEAEGIAYNNQITTYLNAPLCVSGVCGKLAGFGSGSTIVKDLGTVVVDPTKCVDGTIDLSQAKVWAAPQDIADWTESTKITRIDFRTDGMHLDFDKLDGPNRWPDYTPPGWDGPIQYTLWLALFLEGQWQTSGFMQFWYGWPALGGDVTANEQIAINWVYDRRWGPMQGHQPAVGEKVGFFVSAGNARGVPDDSQTLVRERSNVVGVLFPASAGTSVTCDH